MAVVAAAYFMTACGDEVSDISPGGTLTDSLGVAVWTVPGRDVAADMRLERLLALAMPDTGWVAWPDGIAVDPAGKVIYVLDEDAPRVLVFDFGGRFVGEVGRKGHGPGEYDSPTALDVAVNGDLLVMDPGAGFVHRWSSGREYVDQERLSLGYWGPGFAATSRGLLYTTAGDVESGTMIEALISVSSERIDTLATVASKWQPIDMPCGRVPVPEVFSRTAVWAARGTAEEIEAIDVFDQTHGFLGSIESSAFPVVFLDESRYVAIVETESGSILEVWQALPGG